MAAGGIGVSDGRTTAISELNDGLDAGIVNADPGDWIADAEVDGAAVRTQAANKITGKRNC